MFSKHVHKPLAVSAVGSRTREGGEPVERGWERPESHLDVTRGKRPIGHTHPHPLTHSEPDSINICKTGNVLSSLSGLALSACMFSLVTLLQKRPHQPTLPSQGGINHFHSVTFSSAIHLVHFITDIKCVCDTYSRCFPSSLLGSTYS